MKKEYYVEVYNSNLKYILTLNTKYTIVKGSSGTGKTTLFNMIKASDINKIESDLEVSALDSVGDLIKKESRGIDHIYVIDDVSSILLKKNRDRLIAILKTSECYFLIMTRKRIHGITDVAEAVYTFSNERILNAKVDFIGRSLLNERDCDRCLTINRLVRM